MLWVCCEHWKKLSWLEGTWLWTSMAELQPCQFSNAVFLSSCQNHWTSAELWVLLNPEFK